MSALLAASVGSSILKKLSPESAPTTTGTQTPANANIQFKKMLESLQQQGTSLRDLMMLSGSAFQQKIKEMTPDQQKALAQQLFGAQVQVQDASGAMLSGKVDNIHIEGGIPSVDVAGINYKLDKLNAIQSIGNV